MRSFTVALVFVLAGLLSAGCASLREAPTPERQAAIDKANEQPSPYYYGGP